MWQSEYMIHERHKDLLRSAEQARLARMARAERPSVSRWLARLFAAVHRPRLIDVELQPPCPQPCAELGGV